MMFVSRMIASVVASVALSVLLVAGMFANIKDN